MTIPSAADNPLGRAAAHLDAAAFLAMANAQADADPLQTPWASTAHTITLSSMRLAPHLAGPVEPVQHPDCRTGLLAAAAELARLRPDVDVPLADLISVMSFLVPALQHVHDAAEASAGNAPPDGQVRPDRR